MFLYRDSFFFSTMNLSLSPPRKFWRNIFKNIFFCTKIEGADILLPSYLGANVVFEKKTDLILGPPFISFKNSLSISFYRSFYLSVSFSISLSLFLYSSLCISLYFSMSLSLSVSLSPTISLSLSISLYVSIFLSLSISLYLFLSLSLSLSLLVNQFR